jgi:hypothetical protein
MEKWYSTFNRSFKRVNGDDETYKQSKLLDKEYRKVKKLTKKEMERLLSLTDNCYLDYELH